MANEITVAAPPTTQDSAAEILAAMAGLSGVATDYNVGSQIRTQAEAFGAVIEQQGVAAQARALQAIAYSAMAVWNIVPNGAVAALGTVTFATSSGGSPPPSSQAVPIPIGTLLQSAGGIQFVTVSNAVLQAGSSSINIPVQAVIAGASGNLPAGAVTQLVSGLIAPLVVTNALPTSGGSDAETPSQALNRLAAKVSSLNQTSPVSIANGVIGVQASGSSETVLYSTCYEPWVAAGSGAGSGTAGFIVFVDNGTGAATSGLLAAVASTLNGNQASGEPGYRPAGVPYAVSGVVPVLSNVAVLGTLNSLGDAATALAAINTAVSGYYNQLLFDVPAFQAQIAATVANAAIGMLSALTVSLYYASASGTAVTAVTGVAYNRVILNALSVNVA